MDIQVYKNAKILSREAAQLFARIAEDSVKERGRFTVAFSGGSTPQRMYELLSTSPYKESIPWHKTFAFWGDERFVPADDLQNNARMTRKKLLDHVPVPIDQIFAIPTGSSPEKAAKNYEQTLKDVFGPDERPQFDLMLLGLGKNGHTASLFPNTEVLHEHKKWVEEVYVDEKDQYRITMTAPVINNARNIVFMAYGLNKSDTIQQVIEGERRVEKYPAQLIKAPHGSLKWMLDEAAAGELQRH